MSRLCFFLLCFHLYATGQPAMPLPYLSAVELIKLSDDHKAKNETEKSQITLAYYYLHVGNLHKADSLAQVYKGSSNQEVAFRALMLQSAIELTKAVYDKARAAGLEAFALGENVKNEEWKMEADLQAARVMLAIGNIKEASAKTSPVLLASVNGKYKPIEGLTRMLLGEIALKQQDTANAIVFFNDAGELFNQLQLNFPYALARAKKALCLPAVGKTAEAKEIYNHLMFYFYNNQELIHASEIQLLFGNLLFSEKRLDDAIYYYRNALTASQTVQDKGLELIALQSLSAAYKANGDRTQALEAFKQAEQLKATLFDERTLLSIQNLERDFENAQKTKLITQLEDEMMLVNTNLKLKRKEQLITMIVLVLILVVLIMSWFLFKQRMHKKELLFQAQLNDTLNKQEINTMEAILETQESERKRIAGDLHDRVGSMLATVKLQVKSAEQLLKSANPEMGQQMGGIAKLLDEVTAEVRLISHNMESGVLSRFGLAVALQDLASQLNQTALVKINFANHLRDTSLGDKVEVTLYRCCQELVTNAIKHAAATEIDIELNVREQSVHLMVADNGKGFNQGSVKEGLGMKQIKSRLGILNGKLTIDSHQQSGTTIFIEIPL